MTVVRIHIALLLALMTASAGWGFLLALNIFEIGAR